MQKKKRPVKCNLTKVIVHKSCNELSLSYYCNAKTLLFGQTQSCNFRDVSTGAPKLFNTYILFVIAYGFVDKKTRL